MLSHTGSLWQYLGSFVGYTLFAVGLIYGAYWILRKRPANWLTGTAFQKSANAKSPPLELEANLTLEPRKNLYIVRAGQERFLISTTLEQTQCLARLEDPAGPSPLSVMEALPEADLSEERVELPWFTQDMPKDALAEPRQNASKPGFGARMMQSVQWIMESRK